MAGDKDDVEGNDFVAREYQERLAEMAIEKNQIIFLPTGSGKTFISTMVISHFLRENQCADKEIGEGGKRAFFLVNTVALVHQQKEQISRNTPFRVNGYSGDMGVDQWCNSTWDIELDKFQILVMTSQIFLDMLLKKFVTLMDVAVVVFDECHHAVGNHPMKQIMQEFSHTPKDNRPRVVGLSATLLNKNVPVQKVDEEIKNLEITFLAQIATADDENMVKLYSTNPKEFKVVYAENDTTGEVYRTRNRLFEQWRSFIDSVQIDDNEMADKSIKPAGTVQIEDRSKKTNKEMKNVLQDIQVNMDDLGLYGGDIACLVRIIQLQKMIYNCNSEISKAAFSVLNTNLVFLRKYFEIEMGKKTEKEKIAQYSADKVHKLFGILKKMKDTDFAIVFVKRRFTAKIMHKIVSSAARVDPKLKHIKCDFVVGYNVTNPFKDTRENLLQRHYNDKVLDKFNEGLLNVLFGSNVVEEGMDVSNCNMVIMFDAPMDFRSYTQSKGRARHPDSRSIIMTCDRSYPEKHNRFLQVEDRLQNLLCDGMYKNRCEPTEEELQAELFANMPGLEPYMPKGEGGPSITALSAISHVNRYFLSLKADKFTKVNPFWFMKTSGLKFKCFLHLPMESKIRKIVEGTWQSSKENAKRSAALEACKLLHEHGELDEDHLLPITTESRTVNSVSFMPNWDSNERFFEENCDGKKIQIGTKNNKRSWTKQWPKCLTGCMPTAGTQVYLHVLEQKAMYTPPADIHRLMVFHQTLFAPVAYAIISSKPLPRLAPFPLYMSTGELEVNVLKGKPCVFSEAELKKISGFHGILFNKVVGVVKSFLIRDYTNTQNSYLIAPVTIGANTVDIDWDMIEKTNKPFPNPEVKPTEEQRKSLVINEENYLGMVVTPWYRTVPSLTYVVTAVCNDMGVDTEFPSDSYGTYKEYFADKYNIVPLIQQPLLEVRAISSRMNNLKPVAMTKAMKWKNKDEKEDFEVFLVPEFCHLYPVPGCYWLKALLLPSVLHRVAQLCAAEELRVRLVADTRIGLAVFPPEQKMKKLQMDASLTKTAPVEATQLLTPLTLGMTSCSLSKSHVKVWNKDEEPLDIDREMHVSLLDIIYYESFVNQPLCSEEENTEVTTVESGVPLELDPDSTNSNVVASDSLNTVTAEPSTTSQISGKRKRNQSEDPPEQSPEKKRGNQFDVSAKLLLETFVNPPPLKMLQKNIQGVGPEQVQVLQAITAAVANDIINCERLETLGDSFLKFAISLILFETQEDMTEGSLTTIKGQIVGNKNLFFCGKAKKLGNILEIRDFSPREEWLPPQFCVEHSVQGTINTAGLDPSCLYNVTIPEEDVVAGKLSPATIDIFTDVLFSAEDLKFVQTCTFTNTLALTDKNISDAVEAVLGVYLENSGIFGALRVMNWFEVTDPSVASEQVFTTNMTTPVRGTQGTPMDHLLQPSKLELILNYKFQDRAYLLQALSHPTYQRNRITQCYERLEFLGDAIIDFLITVHIYERCTDLHPGDLTDLRSALVNNITLACITVRHNLHRFLLHRSSPLNDVMNRFVKHQEERQHKIDNDILFLLEETEINPKSPTNNVDPKNINISEAIEVPKALGDLFEALVGAIYLDSGKNLNTTWKVVYNLMRNEIEKFHLNVPKNHVRMLYESKCSPMFSSTLDSDGVVMVTAEVQHEGRVFRCNGFGDNKRQAKRAAAKQALRIIRGSLVK